ncbi:MAG: c-type cytochrome, partial [Myxococcales bacterium]|nr:c-type cytochrome [Myxococcales bacterium]
APPGGYAPPGGGSPGGGQVGGGAGGDLALGEELYAQNCAVCHGPTGAGGAVFPGSIQGHTGMLGIVQRGAGAMPGFPNLDATDVAAIEAWLASFLAGPEEVPGGGGGSPQDIFAHTCAGCHGASGEGAARGPQIQSPVIPFATWVVRNGRHRPDFPDAMPPYSANELPDDELDGMLTWLASAPKPTDGPGLYTRFCANCHGAGGRGAVVGGIRGESLGEFREKVREGEGGRNYGNRGSYMPAWSAAQLSDAEITKIYQAVNGTPAPTGGEEEEDGDDD